MPEPWAPPAPSLGGWPAGVWLVVAGLSVLLGVWPDIGTLMIALWGMVTAWFIHGPWRYEDEQQKQTQQVIFLRNLAFVGASIALFSTFVALGDNMRFMLTDPLFSF